MTIGGLIGLGVGLGVIGMGMNMMFPSHCKTRWRKSQIL